MSIHVGPLFLAWVAVLGLTSAPAAVVFLVMTGLPILVTPLVTAARGGEPAWQVMGPVGAITAVGVAVLLALLRGRSAPAI